MSIQTIGDNLETTLNEINNDATLSGEKDVRVFRRPPDQIAALPAIIFWVASGQSALTGSNDMTQFYNYAIDLYVSRQNLQEAIRQGEIYLQPLINVLWNDIRLNDSVTHIGRQGAVISYEAQQFEYAGKPLFGYRYTVQMKQREALS